MLDFSELKICLHKMISRTGEKLPLSQKNIYNSYQILKTMSTDDRQ